MARKEAKRLKSILGHLRQSHNILIKAFWYLIGFYYGGALKEKYQDWFAKKIGWEPRNLTVVNIIIFGFVGGLTYFFFRDSVLDFVGAYFVSWIARLLNVAIGKLLGLYVIYNLVQSFARLVYVEVKGRAIVAFNLFGLEANIFHYLLIFVHRDILKKKHAFHA